MCVCVFAANYASNIYSRSYSYIENPYYLPNFKCITRWNIKIKKTLCSSHENFAFMFWFRECAQCICHVLAEQKREWEYEKYPLIGYDCWKIVEAKICKWNLSVAMLANKNSILSTSPTFLCVALLGSFPDLWIFIEKRQRESEGVAIFGYKILLLELHQS